MNAFAGLVKKDIAISKFGYFLWLGAIVLALIGAFPLSEYFSERTLIVAIVFAIFVAHTLFLPLMMLGTLTTEGKTQLWLHSPQSSAKLLLSKMTSLALFQVISQMLITVYSMFTFNIFSEHYIFASMIQVFGFKEIIIINSLVLFFSLYLSVWIIFYWTVYHSLSQYPSIKRLRWLVLLSIFVLYNVIAEAVKKIPFIASLTSTLENETEEGLFLHYSGDGWTIEFSSEAIMFSSLLLSSLWALILFILSSKLLDRKVEV